MDRFGPCRPLKAQDGHPLELLKRIKGRLDGAVPARRVEGQDTTAGPASAEQDFAGEEPEAVVEDLAGGEPLAEDSPDGLAEQGTTWARASGKNCSVSSVHFKTLYGERLRVLDLQELHAVSSPVMTPSNRSAVELSKEDPVSDAPSRENFSSAGRKLLFPCCTVQFFFLIGSCGISRRPSCDKLEVDAQKI